MSELKLNDFIKAYEEIKKQNFIVDSINKDFFLEFAECLIEKVKELETENHTQRKIIMSAYDRGWIPKQKIKDKIEELKDKAKRIVGTYQYADSGDDLIEKKNKVIELRNKAEALEELLQRSEDKDAN